MRASTRSALLVLTFAGAALAATAQAQSPPYQAEIDAFLERFARGQVNEALDKLYGNNPWIPLEGDGVRNVRAQLQNIGEMVGGYAGAVKIGELVAADRMAHVTYLALFERQPLRFEFQYYRPKNEWMIFSFEFDVDFDEDLRAEARRLAASGGARR